MLAVTSLLAPRMQWHILLIHKPAPPAKGASSTSELINSKNEIGSFLRGV